MHNRNTLSALCLSLFTCSALAAEGKLLATPGVSQVEGSAGGGLVPWSQLAGYASQDEISASGFCSHANVTDYRLNICGAQFNLFDRIELSVAQQNFDIPALSTQLEQSIIGAKIKLYGDIVYSTWPQVSVGIQHKKLHDPDIAYALGAKDDSGTDFYLAASKLHLGALAGYNWFWNLASRYTDANQLGLLGFGGGDEGKQLELELSTAVFINRSWAIGIEYRQKPDNLALTEDDWQDFFIAWFPNKHVNVTAAYLDLGEIAGVPNQTGWYLSVTGNL